MLIKKQVSYLPEICSSVWIAKVDYIDAQSLFNYGFKVENEEEEIVTKEKVTITLALKDMQVGDIFVIGKTTVLGNSNIAWYIIEDQTTFRPITKDTALIEYEQAISDRENQENKIINLNNVSTQELKKELYKRQKRLNKDRNNQQANTKTSVGHIAFMSYIDKK